MKKQLFQKIANPYNLIAITMFLLLLVALIPLLMIGAYAHPCADDFSYGYYTHAYWNSTHSLSQTLHWAFYQVKSTYDTWQGTFSSVFLMALSPAVWGEEYYFLTPIIMLAMIVFPHFYLLYVALVRLLNTPKNLWIIAGSTITFLLIETLHTPVEGIFWYNGAVHYTFMHGCMIYLLGLLLSGKQNKNPLTQLLRWGLACFFAMVCGGSNYPTALLGILITFAVMCISIFKKQKVIGPILVLIVYSLSFYLNITAYGNQLRQNNFIKLSPIEAISNSFLELLNYSGIWITIQVILFLLLLLPIFWRIGESTTFSYPFPLIVTLLSVCSVACMFTPGLYAMGIPGAGRTLNIIKMWLLFLLFLNEGYWIGYLQARLSKKASLLKPYLLPYTAGILVLIFISFVAIPERKLIDYSSYAAYVSLRTGEAEQYHLEYRNRLEILNNNSSVVELPEFTTKPWLLYFDDIQTEPYDWRNTSVARWYGKEQVILKHHE